MNDFPQQTLDQGLTEIAEMDDGTLFNIEDTGGSIVVAYAYSRDIDFANLYQGGIHKIGVTYEGNDNAHGEKRYFVVHYYPNEEKETILSTNASEKDIRRYCDEYLSDYHSSAHPTA